MEAVIEEPFVAVPSSAAVQPAQHLESTSPVQLNEYVNIVKYREQCIQFADYFNGAYKRILTIPMY